MTDIQKENKSGGKVPNLRFPSFYGDWEVKKLGEVADKITELFLEIFHWCAKKKNAKQTL